MAKSGAAKSGGEIGREIGDRTRFPFLFAGKRGLSPILSHAANIGAKPWKYLLAPHDEIAESKRLADFLRFEVKAS